MFFKYKLSNQPNCYNNVWLSEETSDSLWTIAAKEDEKYSIFRIIRSEAGVQYSQTAVNNYSRFANQVRPVLYLKSNVQIVDHEKDGSKDHPYLIDGQF